MSIVTMKKATIILLQSEKDIVLNRLQNLGMLHITDSGALYPDFELEELSRDEAKVNVGHYEEELTKVRYCMDFIKRFGVIKHGMFAPKTKVNNEQYQDYLYDVTKLEEVYKKCKEMDSHFSALKAKETKLQTQQAHLQPWRFLNVALESLKATKHVDFSTGYVASKFSEAFIEEMKALDGEVYLHLQETDKENSYFFVVNHKDLEIDVSHIMKQYGWSKITFHDLTGTAQENLTRIQKELNQVLDARAEYALTGKTLLEYASYLEVLQDILSIERDRFSVMNQFIKTKEAVMVTGWIPEHLVDRLETQLTEATEYHSLTIQEAQDEDMMPTLLKNSGFATPLEFITDQYSIPSSKGIDPNAMMAPFFVCFFGMMVSDAGYGIILALITAFILFKVKPDGNMKKLLGVLFLGGISTTFWGAMFGGWLGGMIKIPYVMFDPLKEPFMMIGLCVGLGVVHLFVGIGMQAYKNIKRGLVLDAVFDQGFWLTFLIGIMLMFIPDVVPFGKYVAIAGAVGLVLTQGRSQKNIVMKFLSGLLSLYNVTGFLGDVLSYLRLFALGLATGVIGTVVNSMASMLGGTIIGTFFMILVLILGHTFNIGINVLGAYVHASRLQYVEFFSKFFEGEGVAYNPFRVKAKFIEKTNN